MPDLIRHPVKLILDSGFRRNDDFDVYCCRSNNLTFEWVYAKKKENLHHATDIAHLGFQRAPFVITGGSR